MSDERFFEAGARIAALRGAMKQSEFAERLGVHRNSVVGWESGKRLPDGESLVRMAEQFNADIQALLVGKSGGVAPALRPDENKLLADYRAAHSDARERIRQVAATAAHSQKRGVKTNAPAQGQHAESAGVNVVGSVGGVRQHSSGDNNIQIGSAGGGVRIKKK